jgi:hypothetical protein
MHDSNLSKRRAAKAGDTIVYNLVSGCWRIIDSNGQAMILIGNDDYVACACGDKKYQVKAIAILFATAANCYLMKVKSHLKEEISYKLLSF